MAVFRVTTFATCYGMRQENVLHFDKTDAIQADMAFLATRVKERWVAPVALNQSGKVVYDKVRVEDVTGDPAWPTIELGFSATGGFFTNEVFPFCCAVLQFKSATAGRHGRGRTFLGGVYADLNGGLWNSAAMVRWNDLSNTLKAWWVQGGANQSLEHGVFDLVIAPRNDPTLRIPVNNIVPRGWAGTQVRRNFLRGI